MKLDFKILRKFKKLDFKILRVDEEKGYCALTYKKEKYFLEFKEGNRFLVRTEDGKERFNSHIAVPSKDYMSYHEYFHSQEFKEKFISDMLKDALSPTEFRAVQGYDDGYMLTYGEYRIIERAHAVCYKDGMYHYMRTDITGDLVEHETFDNEASFWEYIEATPYMQHILSMEFNSYRPKCVNGIYIYKPPKTRQKSSDFWKEKMQQMSDKTVKHSEPVMKKVEVKKPVKKETDTIWLAVLEGSDTAFKYEFVCTECEKKINLRTGSGRYGNLGGFRCPFCGKKYFAQIDDNPQMHVYIFAIDDMPESYLDCTHKPLFELVMLDE